MELFSIKIRCTFQLVSTILRFISCIFDNIFRIFSIIKNTNFAYFFREKLNGT